MPTIDDFEALAIRAGIVLRAEPNEAARHPSIKLWIDFGSLGELQSSAKITDRYTPADLIGRQVVAVTGFEPMRVAGFRSDVLVLGAMENGQVVLLNIDDPVAPGSVIA